MWQAHADVDPLYNGNIAQTFWRTANDNIKRSYGYVYDHLNRLRDAYYQMPGTTMPLAHCYDEYLTYDKNGNILTLFRNGEVDDPNNVQEIDDLTYEYDDGNKLLKVTDATAHSAGFKDGYTDNDPDFVYDDYGNLIKDRNKEIDEIIYNHLNLPKKITFENDNTIEYLYDANGTKLKKTVTDNNASPVTVTTTHYIDGFQYTEDKLDFFPHAEGYVKVTHASSGGVGGGSISYNYVFNYTDHLGNIRLRYAINPVNQWLEILEEDHYYPFGLKHNGYNAQNYVFMSLGGGPVELIPTNPNVLETYKYKLNSIEFQDELGLNMYAMDMRQYDPAIARWVVQDPVTHFSMSPYTAFDNNPVVWADPSGADSESFIQELFNRSSDGEYWTNNHDGTFTSDKGQTANCDDCKNTTGDQDSPPGTLTASNGETLYYVNSGFHEPGYYTKRGVNKILKDLKIQEQAIHDLNALLIILRSPTSTATVINPYVAMALASSTLLVSDEAPARRQRIYVTYTKTGPDGSVYVGRTSGYEDPFTLIKRRDYGHHMTGYGQAMLDRFGTSRSAIRGREQQLIDFFGGALSDPNRNPTSRSANAIRAVSKYNPRGRIYHNSASLHFGQIAEYKGIF